jgi:hypothetical protein
MPACEKIPNHDDALLNLARLWFREVDTVWSRELTDYGRMEGRQLAPLTRFCMTLFRSTKPSISRTYTVEKRRHVSSVLLSESTVDFSTSALINASLASFRSANPMESHSLKQRRGNPWFPVWSSMTSDIRPSSRTCLMLDITSSPVDGGKVCAARGQGARKKNKIGRTLSLQRRIRFVSVIARKARDIRCSGYVRALSSRNKHPEERKRRARQWCQKAAVYRLVHSLDVLPSCSQSGSTTSTTKPRDVGPPKPRGHPLAPLLLQQYASSIAHRHWQKRTFLVDLVLKVLRCPISIRSLMLPSRCTYTWTTSKRYTS